MEYTPEFIAQVDRNAARECARAIAKVGENLYLGETSPAYNIIESRLALVAKMVVDATPSWMAGTVSVDEFTDMVTEEFKNAIAF